MTSSCGIIVPLRVFSSATISVGALREKICQRIYDKFMQRHLQMYIIANDNVIFDVLQGKVVLCQSKQDFNWTD